MSEELEKKRQEKIANFKLNISQAVEQESTESSVNTEPTVSSASTTESTAGNDVLNSYSAHPTNENVSANKKVLKKAKKIDRKRRRKKAKKNRVIFRLVWVAMVLFFSVMVGEYIMVGVNDMLGVGREEGAAVTVTIPQNADIDTITDILYDNHVINTKWFFKLYATLTKSTTGFTRGTFDVATNKDYQALINYMQSDMNRTDVVTLQFTEGMSLKQYARLLEEKKVCSAQEFLKACNSDDFDEYEFIGNISNAGVRPIKLEGYLFPDTYDFYVGEKVDSVVEKFLANYRRKIYGKKTRVLGYDKKMTIAQRAETNGESGLAYLQLDSTKYYPYASLTDIPVKERKTFKSTYNTYDHIGLPPGPICNPGLEAIEAALTVGETEYYYFCHKSATATEPAVAYYAKTMEEHTENLKAAGLL